MKKTKLEKGITLVALIITIVVLLILAVVSIGAVKNSGIIGHATNTSDAWKQAQKNEAGYLQEYESYVASSGATAGVPIPAGFEYVEGTKDTGLVIKHKTEGSEFVWIPVESGTLPNGGSEPAVVTGSNGNDYDAVSTNLEKAGMPSGSTSAEFSTQLTKEYNAMKASVAKYKGFYVGRYEVSYNSVTQKAQSVKGETSANASDDTSSIWYGLYKLCKTYKTSSVTSSMIWGGQWEAIMNFIGSDAADNAITDYNKTRVTGSEDKDKVKNIYDLYGNSFEWTLAANGADSRIWRGGAYYTGTWASHLFFEPPTESDYGLFLLGSRLTLYVEL